MSPATRSVLLAVVFGMMAASFLHERGIVDLSFGFSQGGILEGALTALIGGLGATPCCCVPQAAKLGTPRR